MKSLARSLVTAAGVYSLSMSSARGDVAYLQQARVISAATSADGTAQSIAAPGFGPFVENLDLATTFVTPAGAMDPNLASVGIDCQLNPNAISVSGSLLGAGGISVVGGSQVLQLGEAAARVETLFHVSSATPFAMAASPRPSTRPGDRFKIKLTDETHNTVLFLLDETMPPQAVEFSGVLESADISLEYQVELTVDGPETLRGFFFNLSVGSTCYANCDNSTVGPVLNVADFLCFLNAFAAGNGYANCDRSTTPPALNVGDFICFLNRFAAGCT